MKKIGDLMKELGFQPGASEDVAKAFIKNMVRELPSAEMTPKSLQREGRQKKNKKANSTEQLSLFDKMKNCGS